MARKLRNYADYGEHSPNYLSVEKEKRRKEALQGKSRDRGYSSPGTVGALAGLRRKIETPGEDPQAAQSIGDLMSPSVFGREGPPSSEQEFQERKQRNAGWLKSRETQAALLQFGISMLSSAGGGNFAGNLGKSLALAAGAPGRLHRADRELTNEEREAQLDERKMQVQERQVGISEQELEVKERQMKTRETIFAGLPDNPTDADLVDRAMELGAIGDTEGANLMIKLMGPDLTEKMKNYKFAIDQGFVGTMMDYEKASQRVAVLEQIKQELSAGLYTEATMPPGKKAVWDMAKKASTDWALMFEFLRGGGSLGGLEPDQPVEEGETPPAGGTSGDVHFERAPSQ